MSPEAQRIAIAGACPNVVEWHDGIPYWRGEWSAVGEGNERFAEFDPLNDLNAMHEAKKTLGTSQCIPYLHNLILIVDPKGYRQGWEWRTIPLISATAAQRAEAFLRTVGKWEGGAE